MVQTPADVPAVHCWTIQVADLVTKVIHQLGSASKTPGGKYLLVGPRWMGSLPAGFIDVPRPPTNFVAVFERAFAAHDEQSKRAARRVLNQIGVVAYSKNTSGPLVFDCEASARNKVLPAGVTAEKVAADPLHGSRRMD